MQTAYSQKYKELKIIGRGSFGCVYLIKEKKTNKQWVSKKISLSSLKNSEEKESALKEANLLKKLKNKHIVEYKETFIQNNLIIIIMEYCENGDLSKLIKSQKKKKKKFPEKTIISLFLQMLFGLKYVHKLKILHRDLKTCNMFLSKNFTIKIGDFGISKMLQNTGENAQTFVGTPYYLSPEICKNLPYSYKSDVWSLGCVLYELCTLERAFQGKNLIGLARKIEFEQPEEISEFYSEGLRELVFCLLEKDFEKRPDIERIFEFDIVKQVLQGFLGEGGGCYTKRVSVLEEFGEVRGFEGGRGEVFFEEDGERFEDSFLDDTVQSVCVGDDGFCGDTVKSEIVEEKEGLHFKDITNLHPKQKVQKKIIFKMNSESSEEDSLHHSKSEESIDFQASFEEIS